MEMSHLEMGPLCPRLALAASQLAKLSERVRERERDGDVKPLWICCEFTVLTYSLDTYQPATG